MDFLANNKFFVASSIATIAFGAYALKESVEKLLENNNATEEDEAKLTESVKKIMRSPERKGMFSEDGNPQNSLPLYKICLTGGPCGGKTTGFLFLRIYGFFGFYEFYGFFFFP